MHFEDANTQIKQADFECDKLFIIHLFIIHAVAFVKSHKKPQLIEGSSRVDIEEILCKLDSKFIPLSRSSMISFWTINAQTSSSKPKAGLSCRNNIILNQS